MRRLFTIVVFILAVVLTCQAQQPSGPTETRYQPGTPQAFGFESGEEMTAWLWAWQVWVECHYHPTTFALPAAQDADGKFPVVASCPSAHGSTQRDRIFKTSGITQIADFLAYFNEFRYGHSEELEFFFGNSSGGFTVQRRPAP